MGLPDSVYQKIPNGTKDDFDAIQSFRSYNYYDENNMQIGKKINYINEKYQSIRLENLYYYKNEKENLISLNDTIPRPYYAIIPNYTYTYYLDKKNDLREFDKLTKFVKSSFNLLKTKTSSTNGTTTYNYEFNDIGLVSKITKNYGRVEVSKIFWRKK